MTSLSIPGLPNQSHAPASVRALRAILCGVCALMMTVLVACGPAGQPDATDARNQPGRNQTGSDRTAGDGSEPLRLVPLSPALAVTMIDLGLEDAIVGRHGYDTVLRAELPVCGDQGGIDYERLISTSPTHVLLEWGSRELPARLTELAEENGWQLINFRLLTLEDVAAAADNLYERFVVSRSPERGVTRDGTTPAVPGVNPGLGPGGVPIAIAAEMDRQRPGQRLADAFAMREDRPRFTGTVLLVAGVQPVGVLGPGSAHHELLLSLGGTTATPTGAPWITLDAEDLLTLAPEAIILLSPRERDTPAWTQPPTSAEIRERLGGIGSLDIPANRDGRLGLIDHPHALMPSTALIPVANAMRALLEGWAE